MQAAIMFASLDARRIVEAMATTLVSRNAATNAEEPVEAQHVYVLRRALEHRATPGSNKLTLTLKEAILDAMLQDWSGAARRQGCDEADVKAQVRVRRFRARGATHA